MRIAELMYPKDSPRRTAGIHSKDEIVNCIRGLHKHGIHPRDILKHVTKKFGNDYLKMAQESLREATLDAPRSKEQFAAIKSLFQQPLPVELAADELADMIVDDALNAEFEHAEPGTDARPIIKHWLELNMPSTITQDEELMGAGEGIFSPLHGFDDEDATSGPHNVSWVAPS